MLFWSTIMQKSPEYSASPETPVYDEHVLVALDLDRTLILSDELSQVVYAGLRTRFAEDSIMREVIDDVERLEHQQKDNSFSYLEMLRTLLVLRVGEEIFKEHYDGVFDPKTIAKAVLDAHRDDSGKLNKEFIDTVLVDGTLDYIRELKATGAHVMFMTAGESVTQHMKIDLINAILREQIGEEVESYMIVGAHNKLKGIDYGEDIEQLNKWYMLAGIFDQSQGCFHVQALQGFVPSASLKLSERLLHDETVIRSAVLIDDKTSNFTRYTASELSNQYGRVPSITTILAKKDGCSSGDGRHIASLADDLRHIRESQY